MAIFIQKPWYRKDSGIKIVSFANGTDSEIAAMLNAYYNDELTWTQMGWAIGDTRKIHLNAMTAPSPNGSSTWNAQEITIMIVAHDHTLLETPINGHTKACITVHTRECLNNNSSDHGQVGHIYVDGNSAYDTVFTKWSNLYMRTYLNGTVYDAFSYSTDKGSGTSFKDMVKPSKHYRHTNYNDSASEEVVDKLFLPSYPEIYGTGSNSYYTPTNPVEGTQFAYYAASIPRRIKYGNNNGVSNNVGQYWWLGSAAKYKDGKGYCWCYVLTNQSGAYCDYGNYAVALAPAFVM